MSDIQPILPITDLREFCALRDAGNCCLISEEMYNYFLEVLPPISMGRPVTLVDGAKLPSTSFEFAEGAERITAFWTAGSAFLAQHTNRINRA